MREICGDISTDNKLSKGEKFLYFMHNALRGITEWSFPGKVRTWRGSIKPNGSSSPGRLYVDSYLRTELPKLVLPGKIRVLDIGCGTGYVRAILEELGYTGEYVGLDVVREAGFSEESTAFKVSFVQSRIEDYTSEALFDLVLSNTTLEHVKNDRKAAHVAWRVLSERGIGVHIVPAYWSLFLYLWHGYRQYTPKVLQRVFSRQNYTISALGGLGSFLLHFFIVTLPERVIGIGSIRNGRIYQEMVENVIKLDRFIPPFPLMYAVVITKKKY